MRFGKGMQRTYAECVFLCVWFDVSIEIKDTVIIITVLRCGRLRRRSCHCRYLTHTQTLARKPLAYQSSRDKRPYSAHMHMPNGHGILSTCMHSDLAHIHTHAAGDITASNRPRLGREFHDITNLQHLPHDKDVYFFVCCVKSLIAFSVHDH